MFAVQYRELFSQSSLYFCYSLWTVIIPYRLSSGGKGTPQNQNQNQLGGICNKLNDYNQTKFYHLVLHAILLFQISVHKLL